MSAPFALMMITTVETLLSHYNGHAVHYHHYHNLLRHFATGNDRDVIITRVVNEHLGAKYPHTIKLTNAFRCFILFFFTANGWV